MMETPVMEYHMMSGQSVSLSNVFLNSSLRSLSIRNFSTLEIGFLMFATQHLIFHTMTKIVDLLVLVASGQLDINYKS